MTAGHAWRQTAVAVLLAVAAVPTWCASDAHGAAPQVRITEVAHWRGFDLVRGDAWSPVGSRLAVEAGDRLAVWDAARPADPPQIVLDARVDDVRWSPDGTWLCCRVRVANATRGGAVRLQFVAATGGATEYRIPNAAIGPWMWADDGAVYFWNGQTGARVRVDPPRAWRDAVAATPQAIEPQIVLVPQPGRGRRPRPVLFTPGAAASETALDSLLAATSVQPWCRFRDPTRAAPAWLVTAWARGGVPATFVVDASGRRGATLDREHAFEEMTVTADGRWALAVGCTRPRDGSAPVCTTTLFGTDGESSRSLDDLRGARIQCDRTSKLVAVGELGSRGVRIVRLEGAPRSTHP
jgi:hypothetical protein